MTERTDVTGANSFLDSDELDRSGIDLGATGRLQLMAKLAEGKVGNSFKGLDCFKGFYSPCSILKW